MIEEEPIEEQEKDSGPLKIISGVFLILIIILMMIPSYKIKMDPEPSRIPPMEEVFEITDYNISAVTLQTRIDYLNFVNPTDPVLRMAAAKTITASGCGSNKVCQTKALYYFVRDNINYVSDPVDFNYVEDPKEVLYTKAADCESGTLLLATLLEAIGIDVELVFTPGHALLRADIPEAPRKYEKDGWVYMDWTCSNCEFGEVPVSDISGLREKV